MGNDGNDTIYGNGGDDVLKGGNGNDSIYSGYGNDILDGGKGNDVLCGNEGNDVYIYSKGDGNDTIYDYQGKNTIEFKDINKDEIEFSTEGKDLLITVKDTQGYITIKDIFWRNNEFYFKFADGNTIGIGDLVLAFTGDDQDNTLNGYYGSDILEGKKGNDKLYGKEGDDTYVYHKGDGNDIIYDWQGNNTVDFKDIISSEVGFIKENSNLLVKIRDTNEQITIANFFNSYSSNMKFKFADGTTLDKNAAKVAALIGDNNDNMIQGYDSNDILKGNGGNDTLYGGKGNDTLEGGKGNDILVGNTGVDTYVFGRGGGQDVIYALDADYGRFNIDANGNYNISYYYNQQNVKGTDIIKFKEGITKNDLIFERAGANGHDLLIKIKDTDDSITVKDMFSDAVSSKGIDKIEFADGSFMSTDDIYKNTPLTINRADQERTNGSVYSDIIIGNDQDNIVYANDGDDTLTGDKGNDYLDGGNGSDVYIYNKGDGSDTIYDAGGTDTIKFGQGISKQDIIVKRSERVNADGRKEYRDIKISFKNSPNDSITIKDVIASNKVTEGNKIETFEFENGEKLSFEDIKKLSLIGSNESETLIGYVHSHNIMSGNEGNDKLYGQGWNDTMDGGEGDDIIESGSGNDTLIGGTGNDTLNGGIGDDVYIYNKGDGKDTIIDGGGTDVIKFGQGINKEDLIATKIGKGYYGDIVLTFANSQNDSITIKNIILAGEINNANKIEALEFANGKKLKIEDIKLNIIGTEENDNMRGYDGFSNIIKGNGGNDNIQGGSGNDTITGGDGDDIIKGEDGNDIIDGGTGNDALYGGDGEDTYLFGKGDGQDTVSADGNDIIKFKTGITRGDLILRRSEYQKDGFNNGLILTIKNSLDSITIKDVFKDESNSQGIKGIEFNDGSSMNLEDIKKGVLISSDSDQKTFYGFNSDDTIIGGDSNEYLFGEGGNDTLIGNKGDDIISGGDGNDILIGGEGNDELQGGSGNDTYVFGRGDGNDKIINYDSDSGQNDIIKFEEDITKDDLIFKRVRTSDGVGDLVVSIKGTKDSICVSGMFNVVDNNHILNEQYKINKIEFSDGSYMDLEAIQLALKNNNVIIHSSYFWRNNEGSDEDDEIYGDDDSNYLAGNKGDDILIGGKGADRLNGGEGADTYVFAKGDGNDIISADGNDIIKFKEGISKDDLLITREYSNLKINFKNSDDSITVSGMLYEIDSNSQGIKAIEFSDGSSLSLEDIRKAVLVNNDSVDAYETISGFNSDDLIIGNSKDNVIIARGGNDTVYGKEGNDTISGDAGNDLLIGGEGDDTYEYNMGDGNDTIDNTGGGNDTILFSYGISKDDVSFKKDGNDLIVTVNKDSSQTIKVKNHFLGGDYAIDQIKFASNGSVLSGKDISKLMNTVHLTSEGGNNNLVDKGQKDNVYTYAGGRVTISDNGGYDKVIFKNKTYSVNYSKKGDNLLISANKITASNNNVLEIKDFFKGANHIIEDFDLSEYSLVTARRIYEDFGITYPVAQSKQEVLTGGKEDNVYIYTGGRKIIDDKGGNDRVVFQGLEEGLFYRQKGNNLLISTKKMTTDNEDILEIKNFFSSKNSIIEEFQITDYWSVSARKIYEDFDETYPQSAPNNIKTMSVTGNTSSGIDINRLIQDINSYSNNSAIASSSSDILRNDNSITLAMNQGV